MKHLIAFAKQYGPVFVLIGLTFTLAHTGIRVVWLLSGISGKLDSAVQRLGGIESSLGHISEKVNHLEQRTSVLEERTTRPRSNGQP